MVNTSEYSCLHLWYKAKEREKKYGSYNNLVGQDTCLNHYNTTKYMWNSTDPTSGANFQAWKRYETDMGGTNTTYVTSCEETNGRMNTTTGICYTYEIVKRICVKIGIETSGTASIVQYEGGCYTDNAVGYYTWAKPDKQYKLEYVPVEVRSMYDPYVAWAESGYIAFDKKNPAFDFSTTFVAITMVFAVITFVLYIQAKGSSDEESEHLRKNHPENS